MEEQAQEYEAQARSARKNRAMTNRSVAVYLPGVSRRLPANEFVDAMQSIDPNYAAEISERIQSENFEPGTASEISYGMSDWGDLSINYGRNEQDMLPETLQRNVDAAGLSGPIDQAIELEWINAGAVLLLGEPARHPRELYALCRWLGYNGRVKITPNSEDPHGRPDFQVTEPTPFIDEYTNDVIRGVINYAVGSGT